MAHIKKIFKIILNWFGFHISNNIVHMNLISQRDTAINIIANGIEPQLDDGVVGVIFSRDRAMQLHALLTSYAVNVKNPAPLYVFYSTSDEPHAKSYNDVSRYFDNQQIDIKFIDHGGIFYKGLIDLLTEINSKKIFFLCDDDVFIRKIDFSILNMIDSSKHILSLRHSPNLKFSYTLNTKLQNPAFKNSDISSNLLDFAWFETQAEWSDPWSLDGHILPLSLVRSIAKTSRFDAPNSFENALKSYNSIYACKRGLCFNFSVILNLPLNQVQMEYVVKNGNIKTSFLLEKWNCGFMFDTTFLDSHVPLSLHEEHEPRFIKRNI